MCRDTVGQTWMYPDTRGLPGLQFLSQNSPCVVKTFACLFKNLEVCSNYIPRTAKVLKAATLGRIDKHEEQSEEKMIIFVFYEMTIHRSSVVT
jgi:hypothetical protein